MLNEMGRADEWVCVMELCLDSGREVQDAHDSCVSHVHTFANASVNASVIGFPLSHLV